MIEEKFVETKLGRICYLEAGKGKNTLVFLHGWFWWPMLVEKLAAGLDAKNCRIIAPYLPGHGKSYPLPSNYDFDDLVDTFVEFLEKVCSNTKVVLMGHSLGGAVFWEVAVKKPEIVSRLILLDAGLKFLWGKSAFLRLSGWLFNQFIDRRGYFGRENPIWRVFGIKGSRYGPQLSHPFRLWHLSAIAKISEDRLPAQLPVLGLWGRQDYMTPLREYSSVLKKVKSFTLLTFPGGHGWFIWQQEKLVSAIKDFI